MSAREDRMYEQERLLLYVQEALSEAIERSGLRQADVARALYVNRPAITQALSSGRNLTLRTAASIAHACGFRLVVKLQKLEEPHGR